MSRRVVALGSSLAAARERAERKPVHTIQFDGPCPYLMCLQTQPHSHPVCPDCGVVRYGNLSCATCRENRPVVDREDLAARMWREPGRLHVTEEPTQ